jgi:GT2 family glycosyltransferase
MRDNYKVAVVVPTRNRLSELKNLLKCLEKQDQPIFQMVIVDSSNSMDCQELCENSKMPIEYVHTAVKSAAIQRNMGIERLRSEITHLAFLDDDVVVEADYLTRLIDELELNDGVGISGVALNPNARILRGKPKGLIGYFHRFFLLDSIHDGKLLSSAINVPVRNYHGSTVQVDWLIGCSVWDFRIISQLRFEKDFNGQSLGEDVIFSFQAGKLGKLFTNPKVVIAHSESPVGRPDSVEFYEMWVKNRYRLIELMKSGNRGKAAFAWANIGQALILSYLRLRKRTKSVMPIKIIFSETIKSLRTRST